MKVFIPKIEHISPGAGTGVEIGIEESDFEVAENLSQYGEGANKLFRILLHIYLQKGKRVCIDEIDAGIHFTRFVPFWKIILKFAKDHNVQIFASTHNEECIEFFASALADDEMIEFRQKSRVITLAENIKTGAPVTRVRNYDGILYALEQNRNIRGGQL